MPSAAIWDFWAPRYHRLFVQRYVLEPTRRLVHSYLAEHMPDARRICDIGCGIGQLAWELATQRPAAQVLGIDPSPTMLARTAELPPLPNLAFRLGSLAVIAEEEAFDIILATHAFPYLPRSNRPFTTCTACSRPPACCCLCRRRARTPMTA